MKKFLFSVLTLTIVFTTVGFEVPHVAQMLGVSAYSAKKVIDAIFMGASVWTIVALIAAGGGIAAVSLASLKYIVKLLGKTAALAW